MRFFGRITALLLALLLACVPALAMGEFYGSFPEDDVYQVQTVRHTCTLIAATMMVRNFACQRGTPYALVTEDVLRPVAWTKQYGLSHNFSIGQVEVQCNEDIRRTKDKKQYLIDALKTYTGGVVIYDTGAPHAIWLFRYDVDTDTFWCADTFSARGGHAITLEESSIRGKTQQDKINTIDKIWYVVIKKYNI